jgi:hypothetical protein
MKLVPKKSPFQLAPIIVTDFSWVLINSIMTVFNKTNIELYIDWCYKIVMKEPECLSNINDMEVRLQLCCAHFLKMVTDKVHKIKKFNTEEKDKKLQKIFIFTFTLLQNAYTIEDFTTYFKYSYNLFNNRFNSISTAISLSEIKTQLFQRNLTVLTIDNDEMEKSKFEKKVENLSCTYKSKNGKQKNEKSLFKKSLFRIHFENVLKEEIDSNKDELNISKTENEFYCPQMFDIIKDYIHILPLWSGFMLFNWQELNPNYNHIKRLSNNPVENWFDQLKNVTLRKQKVMPSFLTTKMYQKIEAEYEVKYKLKNIELNKTVLDKEEQWGDKKSKKQGKKGIYYKRPLKNLFNIFDKSMFN